MYSGQAILYQYFMCASDGGMLKRASFLKNYLHPCKQNVQLKACESAPDVLVILCLNHPPLTPPQPQIHFLSFLGLLLC